MSDKKKILSKKDLNNKLKECEKEKAEYLKGWQRAKADFLNYKKGDVERMKNVIKYEKEDLILEFLEVLDNFVKAEKETPKKLRDDQYFKGFLHIRTQFQDLLEGQGAEEIKTVGEKLDLNCHEIVGEVEVDDKEPGTIVEEVQKGYFVGGKLLRAAKVKIVK